MAVRTRYNFVIDGFMTSMKFIFEKIFFSFYQPQQKFNIIMDIWLSIKFSSVIYLVYKIRKSGMQNMSIHSSIYKKNSTQPTFQHKSFASHFYIIWNLQFFLLAMQNTNFSRKFNCSMTLQLFHYHTMGIIANFFSQRKEYKASVFLFCSFFFDDKMLQYDIPTIYWEMNLLLFTVLKAKATYVEIKMLVWMRWIKLIIERWRKKETKGKFHANSKCRTQFWAIEKIVFELRMERMLNRATKNHLSVELSSVFSVDLAVKSIYTNLFSGWKSFSCKRSIFAFCYNWISFSQYIISLIQGQPLLSPSTLTFTISYTTKITRQTETAIHFQQ